MNYLRAVQALTDAGVEFVIIGGWSAIIHGSSYSTNDLDICYPRRRDNLKRLTAALMPFHPRPVDFSPDLPFVWDEATLRNRTIFTLMTDLGEIELLAEVAGVGSYDEVKRNSVKVQAFEREVYTLDLSALIRSKRAAGRTKDLLQLPELEGLLEANKPE